MIAMRILISSGQFVYSYRRPIQYFPISFILYTAMTPLTFYTKTYVVLGSCWFINFEQMVLIIRELCIVWFLKEGILHPLLQQKRGFKTRYLRGIFSDTYHRTYFKVVWAFGFVLSSKCSVKFGSKKLVL